MLMRRANLHDSKLLFGIFLINEDSPFMNKEMPPMRLSGEKVQRRLTSC